VGLPASFRRVSGAVDAPPSTWIFGYGSLLFRADFPHRERAAGWLGGFRRKLWQGSPDHRGTPEHPGRVATLVADPAARVLGAVFAVEDRDLEQVLAYLDVREQAGYERRVEDIALTRGGTVRALVYLAKATNPSWLGHAPPDAIAEHVLRAVGPSGHNRDYVLGLAEALRALGLAEGEEEEEVFHVERHLRR
jgi:cation transport protein ChaC